MKSSEKRKARIQAIERILKQARDEGKTVDKEKLIGNLGYDWGMSRRILIEYINNLKLAEKVKEDGSIISYSAE